MSHIRDKLLKLIQKINSVGSSFPMLYIRLDFIEKMEEEKSCNPVFEEALTKINILADKALKNIKDYISLIEIKNIYSEVYIFSKLKSLLVIEKITEKEEKTPDYRIRFRGKDIYIELKSLNMLDGPVKHRTVMNESLDSKIVAEEQIRKGSRIGFGEQVVRPYFTPNKDYNPRSVKLVIESLIDKINQNVKKGQYLLGDTILLIDLSDQLTLIATPSQAILKKYYDEIGNVDVNGELWNVAFGQLEDQILKPSEFEGENNNDGQLSKEGILLSHPYIQGIIFHVDENFYSLAEIKESNLDVIELLEYLSKQHSFKYSIKAN